MDDIEKQVVHLCFKELTNSPQVLAQFVSDLQDGTAKTWLVYKQKRTEILLLQNKARHAPKRKPGCSMRTAMFQARQYDRHKNKAVFIPQLPLNSCKTLKEKVKMIMSADCSMEIKAELLEVHI